MQQTAKLPIRQNLRKINFEMTDEEIAYKPGKGEVWLTKLLQKMHNSKKVTVTSYANKMKTC